MILINKTTHVAEGSGYRGLDSLKGWTDKTLNPTVNSDTHYLLNLAVPADFKAFQFTLVNGSLVPNDNYVPTPAPVPTLVTPRQARLILALQPATDGVSSTLLAQVEAAFESLPEPQKTVAKVTWEYSTEVQRSNPLIAQMQAVIGFTAAQIDQLFIEASKL